MNRHNRQSFLGPGSEAVLKSIRIGLVGLGGGGSHVNQQLAHLGVHQITAVDFDTVEDTNLNRLVGATVEDVVADRLKVLIAKRVFLGLNPEADYQAIPTTWQEAAGALGACDIIIGGVDSYTQRSELEAFCRRLMIPYVDMGMDVHELDTGFSISGQTILSMPGGPCMWCTGYLTDARLREEAARYGAAGGKPQVVWPNGVLASLAVGLVVKLLTPWRASQGEIGAYLEYDGDAQTVRTSNRFRAVADKTCRHYPSDQVGDPLIDLRLIDPPVDTQDEVETPQPALVDPSWLRRMWTFLTGLGRLDR